MTKKSGTAPHLRLPSFDAFASSLDAMTVEALGDDAYYASWFDDSDDAENDDDYVTNADDADDADDGFPDLGLREGLPSETCSASRNSVYVVYEPGDDIRGRRELINRACGVLGTSERDSEALLHFHAWNLEDAVTSWFENERKAREACGLSDPDAQTSEGGMATTTCNICFDDFEPSELVTAGCSHAFCTGCWAGYIASKIGEGLSVVDTRCPMTKCPIKVGEATMRRFLNEDDAKKFDVYLGRSFVESNVKIQPCTGIDCERSIVFENLPTNPVAVNCTCGKVFCFSCGGDTHHPIPCKVASEWTKKITLDGANSEWMLVNTKPCPKCQRPILKNGGCMHMQCSQCHTSFCWLCSSPWDAGPYACSKRCNQYKRTESNNNETRKKRARESLERYVFYYERYRAHENSGKKALEDVDKFKSSALGFLIELQRTSETQVGFVMKALKQVSSSRQILKWTYAYAYYELADDVRKKNFFEHVQGEMERALELISRMIELDIKAFLPPDPDTEDDEKVALEKAMAYRYPPEEQDKLEKAFEQYKTLLIDRTAVLRKSCDTLCIELENGLLGMSTPIKGSQQDA